jgi:hypothetical protein
VSHAFLGCVRRDSLTFSLENMPHDCNVLLVSIQAYKLHHGRILHIGRHLFNSKHSITLRSCVGAKQPQDLDRLHECRGMCFCQDKACKRPKKGCKCRCDLHHAMLGLHSCLPEGTYYFIYFLSSKSYIYSTRLRTFPQ